MVKIKIESQGFSYDFEKNFRNDDFPFSGYNQFWSDF